MSALSRRRSAIFAAAAMLAVAACGSDDDSTRDTAATDASVAAPTSESPSPAESTRLTISVFNGALISMYAELAEAQGFYDEENLEVEFLRVASGPELVTALVSGTSQVGDVGNTITFPLMKNGEPIVYLTNNHSLDYNIVAGPEVDLPNLSKGFPESLKDLTGKTVGVPARGAVTEFFAQRLMEAAGMDPDNDVTFVAVGGAATAVPALQEGQIDALVTFAPEEQLLGEGNFQMVVDNVGGATDVFDGYMLDGYATTRAFVESNPDVVNAFCRALWKTHEFAQDEANAEAVATFLEGYIKLGPEQARQVWNQYKGTFNPTLSRSVWELQSEFGQGEVAGYVPPWDEHVYEPCTQPPA